MLASITNYETGAEPPEDLASLDFLVVEKGAAIVLSIWLQTFSFKVKFKLESLRKVILTGKFEKDKSSSHSKKMRNKTWTSRAGKTPKNNNLTAHGKTTATKNINSNPSETH